LFLGRVLSSLRLELLNPLLLISPCLVFPNLTRMPGSSLSAVETVSLNMRELRERLLGYDKDEYTGNWVLRVRGFGEVLVNRNVVRRFKGIDGVLHAPDNWLASIRMNGEAWLFRIASPSYVDIPGSVVLQEIKGMLPGVGRFGKWEAERLWIVEGAEYGEVTGVLGRDNHPRIGDFVYLIRVMWGNDGYSAFRVFKAIGIIKCTNGLVVGFNAFKRIFHAKLNAPLHEKINDILRRIKDAITSVNMNNSVIEALSRTPIEAKVVEDLAKKFPDFMKMYAEYRREYGDTMMAVYQVLGWIATHGSSRNSEKAVSTMNRLLASLN